MLPPAAYPEHELRRIVCWLQISSAEILKIYFTDFRSYWLLRTLLDLLPSEFDKSDLLALRVKRKQSTTKQSIGTILLRWKKAGKIEQVEGLAKFRQLKKS